MNFWNYGKLDVNKKIRLGLGFSLFVLLISAFVAFYTIYSLIRQSELVKHTHQIILTAEQLISSLKDAEASQRAYLLSGNSLYLEYYTGTEKSTFENLRLIREYTIDNESQQKLLDQLEPIIKRRFDTLDISIREFTKISGVNIERLKNGRNLMVEIRSSINKIITWEQRLLKIRTEKEKWLAFISPIVILGMSFLSIIISGLALYFITRDIRNKEKIQQELSESNFLLDASARLNENLREEKFIGTAGKKILNILCEELNADAGLIYISDENHRYNLVETNAISSKNKIQNSFKEGDGLLGKAAEEQKIIILNEIPENTLTIESGLINIEPSQLVIVPFYINDKTVAVAEFICRIKISELQLKLLHGAIDIVAVFLNNLKSEMRTAELLSETQNQAEELELQQEELRLINEELREQRDRLQASEEELRLSEEELQEKNAELELHYESLRNKNQELEVAKEALQFNISQIESVSKYKSDFLANMSHELRTPLNSILILAALLKENKSRNLNKKEVEQAEVIEKSGNDLLKLINEILDLARVESGKIKLEQNECSLSDFNLKNEFKDLARNKKIDFNITIDEEFKGKIITDKFRVEQVLRNLLSNAFKFTPTGGNVDCTIARANENLKFATPSLKNAESVIAFSVKDTGIGIPEDKQELIFEAFQQADHSTTRKYGGSGLGLTISRDITNFLGGEIHLSSAPDEGSTFTVYLPQVLETPVYSREELEPEIPEKNLSGFIPESLFIQKLPEQYPVPDSNTILIVEDDIFFSRILAEYTSSRGFDVKVANTGNDGLKLIQEETFRAVLLDINLPDISGWEVLKKIKNNTATRFLQVHMMSAYDSNSHEQESEFEDFIPKPVTLEKLDKAFNEINKSADALKKVLIAEDNEIESLAVKELLASQGIAARCAFTGQMALNMLHNDKFDCVILDISLPDLNGYNVLEKIKTDADLAHIPVIIYSGKDLSEAEEKKIRKYANTIIIKTEYSYTRLLDEVKLFMHNVGSKLKTNRLIVKSPDRTMLNKKVLIVDDDMRNIFSLSSVLEDEGMQIIVACDGRQAIDELKANPDTDIVLMDIMMPEMDGIESTRIIRTMSDFTNLPVIALTAKAMEGDREKCLEAGISDYIAKPIDIVKLLSLMRVWVYKN